MPAHKKSDPKLENLKMSGTLNPRPGKVGDDLFRYGNFFDSRDMIQVKYEMLRRVSVDNWNISRASRAFGFSRPSFYQVQAEFENAGLSGFIPKQRGPREAHKLSGQVMQFLEQAKLKDGSLRTADLVKLVEEQFGLTIHRRTIERAFTRSKKKQNT